MRMAETLPRAGPPAPPFPVLFRDNRFLVIDKPAGIPVHAGPSGGRNVEDALRPLARGRDGPWLAHRLDADTSGCLLIALRRSALRAAQAEFAARRVHKTYWALVRAAPAAECGVCDAPLLRISGPHGWRMAIGAGGQEAVTEWRLRGRGEGLTWLELMPRTGTDPSGARALRGARMSGRRRCNLWRWRGGVDAAGARIDADARSAAVGNRPAGGPYARDTPCVRLGLRYVACTADRTWNSRP